MRKLYFAELIRNKRGVRQLRVYSLSRPFADPDYRRA
jgi:hypothetical protein